MVVSSWMLGLADLTKKDDPVLPNGYWGFCKTNGSRAESEPLSFAHTTLKPC